MLERPEEVDNFGDLLVRRDIRHSLRFKTLEDLYRAIIVYAGADPEDVKTYSFDKHKYNDKVSFALQVVHNMGLLPKGHYHYNGESLYSVEAPELYSVKAPVLLKAPDLFRQVAFNVGRCKDGTYTLSFYDNQQIENDLSTKLGIPVGYHECKIKRFFAATREERFRVPLSAIVSVYRTFEVNPPVRNRILNIESPASPVAVFNDNKICATLSLDIKRSVDPEDIKGIRRDQYRLENGFLTGPARIDKETGRPMAIGINVVIAPYNAPTYDPQLAERIQALGTAVESTLKITTPTPKHRPRGHGAEM